MTVRLPPDPEAFVLLDDARVAGAAPARLYRDPIEIVTTGDGAAVPRCLAALRKARAAGLHAAGYIAYDAGALGEAAAPGATRAVTPGGARGATLAAAGAPLLWFGLFRDFTTIEDVSALLPDPAGAWIGKPVPRVGGEHYAAAFSRARAYIAAGDIYQANLTFQADCAVLGDPLALYARLRGHAAAGWGGIVRDGRRTILSFSPELFFHLDAGAIVARPMKGTAARAADPAADTDAARSLGGDIKQRAENLMIVDLLRNDLSRVADPGSVAVPALFTVETYPTVHQMTSTVTATLADGKDAVSVLEAAFPCGSITGAPKLRAMEIALEVEQGPRGLYTGSIGRLDADGSAAFNVAIRTLVLDRPGLASLGLGSAIVADSVLHAEWRECLVKGAFVGAAARPFDLVETMRFDPVEGVVDLERHLARMRASATALAFAFDRHGVRNELQAATFRLRVPTRLRLLLAQSGRVAIEARPMPPRPEEPVVVPIVPLPVAADDFRLAHKTTDRGFYDRARDGAFEVLFARPDGILTEGSFSNVFVARGDTLLTPPLARGLLPGVLRRRLIEEGEAEEADLTEADLADGFLIGNALRGLIRARLP